MRSALQILIFSFAHILTCYGQDTLFTKDGEKLNVKILEINRKEGVVKYNLNGEKYQFTYHIPTSDVQKIVYNGGLIITNFKYNGTSEKANKEDYRTYDNKNLVAINLIDLAFKNLTFSYERFITKGYLGLKCPVSIGLQKTGEGSNRLENKILSVGFDLNFYPTAQGAVRVFMGPAIETGMFWYKAPLSDGTKISEPELVNIFYTCWYLNFGFMVQSSDTFTFSFLAGFGGQYSKEADYYNYSSLPETSIYPTWNIGVNMGYRF